MSRTHTPTAATHPHRRRFLAVGAVAAGLSVVGAGAGTAMAVAPTSSLSRAVAGALHTAGVDWSSMPAGYTQAQYEAFWGAGYTAADVAALGALWHSEATETKAQAGQMILDGAALPIAPGSTADASPDASAQTALDAFWGAGYTYADAEALGALWNSDVTETKARAGQMILDGQTPPVAPGSTPVVPTAS